MGNLIDDEVNPYSDSDYLPVNKILIYCYQCDEEYEIDDNEDEKQCLFCDSFDIGLV